MKPISKYYSGYKRRFLEIGFIVIKKSETTSSMTKMIKVGWQDSRAPSKWEALSSTPSTTKNFPKNVVDP
jgi:hypothetical protein